MVNMMQDGVEVYVLPDGARCELDPYGRIVVR